MPVKYAQMEDKLLTLDNTKQLLETTEPLGTIPISAEHDTEVKWHFSPDWAMTLDSTHGNSPVKATIEVNGDEFQLTKDAVLTAASAFGLPGAHARVLPAYLTEQEMNYWFGAGIGKKSFNLLTVGGDTASAFIKATRRPFSNLHLLDAVESAVRRHMGNTPILVDYKFNHSLTKTDMRLVLPELLHTIDSDTEDDQWSAGIHLTNSLSAASQTVVDPYLFRWVCTNGATSEYSAGAGVWNRRVQGQEEEDVMAWAEREVDAIFEHLPKKWDEIQKLTQVSIEGNATEILREVFKTYRVPYTQQNEIISQLADDDAPLTMYSLMNAITQLANNPSLKIERVDQLLRIGGAIPTALFDPLNAKLWEEGHHADPTAHNPYTV